MPSLQHKGSSRPASPSWVLPKEFSIWDARWTFHSDGNPSSSSSQCQTDIICSEPELTCVVWNLLKSLQLSDAMLEPPSLVIIKMASGSKVLAIIYVSQTLFSAWPSEVMFPISVNVYWVPLSENTWSLALQEFTDWRRERIYTKITNTKQTDKFHKRVKAL